MAQTNIGVMYAMGHGVPQNYLEALKWYRLAADQGEVLAQYYLGGMYGYGLGVPQNYNSALMWFILAAAQGNQPALKDRDKIARLMTREQIAEAQRQAAGWAPKTASRIADLPQNPSPRKTEMAASLGTGFFVSTASEFLTNAHVVEGCREIRVNGSRARLLARDDKNDLALIEANSEDAIEAINALVREPRTAWRTPVQLGEEIVVYGFPLPGVLSTDGNVAMGNVTALAGLEDDARFLQISAPVQSGNSGGPVFDRYGNVIGVVVAKLDAFKVASAVGDVPQNVNFAIKASVAIPFLKANHVHFSEPPINAKSLSTPEISKLAKKITAQVVCSH